jgi:hypothetical protein
MKSKITLSVLLFVLVSFNGFSQYKGFEVRFNTGGAFKMNVPLEILSDRDDLTFKASTFSMDAIGYYAFNQKVSGRLRLGYRSSSLSGNYEMYDVNDYSYKINLMAKNRSFTIAPGITRNFTFEKLTFLTTAELPFVVLGDLNGELTLKEEDNTGTLTDQKNTAHVDGGMSLGLNGIAGFRYSLYKGLSVGIDLNMGLNYLRMKGQGDLETLDYGSSSFYEEQEFSSRLISVTPLSGSLVVGMKF